MLKPLLRTIILASILFFLLVYMGIKYHWGNALKGVESNQLSSQLELKIPDIEELTTIDSSDSTVPIIEVEPLENDLVDNTVKSIDEFQPEIINNAPTISLIDAMTKDQIALDCQHLYNDSFNMANDPNVELLIGNCVVSNYQEPFDDNVKTPLMIQQEQHKKLKAISNCRYQILQPVNAPLTNIEKQLLIGVCVSNQAF